jgi:hypothetical protein
VVGNPLVRGATRFTKTGQEPRLFCKMWFPSPVCGA